MTDYKSSQISFNPRAYKNAKERRGQLESFLNISLSNIGKFSFEENRASLKNIENIIGGAQLPLGIAGPLIVKSSEFGVRSNYLPLATTEGALVASVSRGCKAVTESGGAVVHADNTGMTRGPVFYTGSLEKSRELAHWIKTHTNELKQTAETTSRHLVFKKATVSMLSDHIFVRFSFDTGDAMGMNMVSIATEKIAELIESKTGIKCLSVAGNFDIDKKPAWLNFINNRGYRVWAEVRLKKDTLKRVLKVSPQELFDIWLAKCMYGSAMSGSLGFNAHYANIIAAIFIATGQDPAHVVEGSMGITSVKILPKGDLYFSVYLPSVIAGTVGGGTKLGTQAEALQIMGLDKPGNTGKFAEIIGGAVLAGELSLLASLSEGSLGRAHERLGRGR